MLSRISFETPVELLPVPLCSCTLHFFYSFLAAFHILNKVSSSFIFSCYKGCDVALSKRTVGSRYIFWSNTTIKCNTCCPADICTFVFLRAIFGVCSWLCGFLSPCVFSVCLFASASVCQCLCLSFFIKIHFASYRKRSLIVVVSNYTMDALVILYYLRLFACLWVRSKGENVLCQISRHKSR